MNPKMIPLVSARSISKAFTGKPFLNGLSLVIGEEDRVAFIGPNGAGKSTLLRMFAGLESPDEGEIIPRSGLRVAYVPQQERFKDETSVYDLMLEAFESHHHDAEATVAKYLARLGLSDSHVAVGTLSGGWKKRLAITRALATEPDLLLLDEPTNHLDVDGILWLEDFLKETPTPWALVSHDRYFIESTARRVIEINQQYPGGYLSVTGSYSDFLSTRADTLYQLQKAQASLAERVRREVAWLRQGAKARTTKSKHRTEVAHGLVEQLNSLPRAESSVNLSFSATERKTKELLKLEVVEQSFEQRKLFSKVSFVLAPGVRLGIVGPNGSGKTTLLKTVLGDLAPKAGRILRASNLRVARFEQNRQTLDPQMTVAQALCSEGNSVVFQGRQIHVHGWASRFLLRSDQLNMPFGKLSGGEQARVILARIMLEPADLLVFDEPTNDLDIDTLEVLEDSLLQFPGALLLVTHDRYLLDRVATSIIGLQGDGSHEHFASYSQWEAARRESLESGRSDSPGPTRKERKLSQDERKELKALPQKIEKAEAAVTSLQQKVSEAQVRKDISALKQLSDQLQAANEVVAQLFSRWEELEASEKTQ